MITVTILCSPPPVLIYLFLNYLFFYLNFGCAGPLLLGTGFLQLQRARTTLPCSTQASHCGGFSLQSKAPGCIIFSSCSSPAPEHRLSSVAHGLSCFWVCGIFLDQGSNLRPLHWGGFPSIVPPETSFIYLITASLHLLYLLHPAVPHLHPVPHSPTPASSSHKPHPFFYGF